MLDETENKASQGHCLLDAYLLDYSLTLHRLPSGFDSVETYTEPI